MNVQNPVITSYEPISWQGLAHASLTKHNVLVMHRRGTKSVFCVNEIIDKALRFNEPDRKKPGHMLKNPKFAFIATTVGQVEKIAWDYFKLYMQHIPGVKFNEGKLRITFPHVHGICTIYLFGAENFNAMRGIYLDGYVLDEYADMHPDVRDKVLLPTISDRDGWEIIIGTPKGDNSFKRLYDIAVLDPDWFTLCKNITQTGLFPEKQIAMMKKTMTEEAWEQEYMCNWNAVPSGKYYETYIQEAAEEGRICSVPYDHHMGVFTFWDLGYGDSTGIWFIQEVGREIHVIDYIEEHGKGLEHYTRQIHSKPYHYAGHILPWDAEHHELQTGKTRVEFLQNHGLRDIEVMPKTVSIADDIHCVRMVLPKCYFDQEKTAKGLDALRAYQRKYDAKTDTYSQNPLHNWASNGADAFRTFGVYYQPGFGMGRYGSRFDDQGVDILSEEADHDYDPHNF
jgi:hypothetical protein